MIAWLNHPGFRRAQLPSIGALYVGGARLNPEPARRVLEANGLASAEFDPGLRIPIDAESVDLQVARFGLRAEGSASKPSTTRNYAENWQRFALRLLLALRKQLLLWRILPAEGIDDYIRRGHDLFAGAAAGVWQGSSMGCRIAIKLLKLHMKPMWMRGFRSLNGFW